ncbi:hypothetical protein GOP47_0001543 [Adiantum capillus-veneris]|uniref:L-gulonolactone oxidase n=1 Tax=Adiantum capillus-veneris TaxID=13818 RepID=A0A9D4V985_ADICA|nr:hypothetical protein GOP47_0001543 [Adiantum capillus-veneris]
MELSSFASGWCKLLFIPLILSLQLAISTKSLLQDPYGPPNPVHCGPSFCTISNTYGVWPDRRPCRAQHIVYPTSESELLAAVAEATRKKQKMKVVSRLAHSIPKLICPGGQNGLVISTRDYDTHLAIDQQRMRVEVDSGMELRKLIDNLAAGGFALPYTPYWDGLSIGGLISTGAHGSSFFQKGGAVHEYVVGMRLVIPATKEEGFARIIDMTEDDEELLSAAKVSLGVLGVISKVSLQVEPLFKRSITNEFLMDADMEDRILSFASTYEFGDVLWHPSQRKAVYKMDSRVWMNAPGDGVNDFIGFRAFDVAVVEASRILETSFELTEDALGKCVAAHLQITTLSAVGKGLKNSHTFTGYPVVGYHHRLQASGSCLITPHQVCPWDSSIRGEFFHQTTFSIGVSKVKDFLRDIKALRDLEHMGFCGVDLYNGVYLRFLKASTAFLGEQEDAVSFDFTYYRTRDSVHPRLLEDVMEEVEQIAIFKYGGRPHWGKNRPVAFIRAWEKYPNLPRFLAVKKQLDPEGLFSSEWTDAILGILSDNISISTDANQWPSLFASYTHDGCALEGLCICSEDAHCAPHLSYLCQPGRIYPQARVCRKMSSTSTCELEMCHS